MCLTFNHHLPLFSNICCLHVFQETPITRQPQFDGEEEKADNKTDSETLDEDDVDAGEEASE